MIKEKKSEISNEQKTSVITHLNRILQKAGFVKYYRDDGKIGFTLVLCSFCGDPIDENGNCIGCGKRR